jgi:putative transposase
MPRSLRIEYPGAVYHVLNRGNYRSDVFGVEGSKEIFEQTLIGSCERFGWILHAYCLLDNHYHMAIETPDSNLSVGMQWLQSTYANRFNRLVKERGHVFQGRYKSLVIERDKKSAAWKVMIAHYLKRHTAATNGWLSHHLNMGVLNGVSRYVAAFEGTRKHQKQAYKRMVAGIKH